MSIESVKMILKRLLELSGPLPLATTVNLATELKYIHKLAKSDSINRYQSYDAQLQIKAYAKTRKRLLITELRKRDKAEKKLINILNHRESAHDEKSL